jgi:SNF2 family DNA or RNA helicase
MERVKYQPRDYQKHITRALLETKRQGIWAGMGLGKTVATLTAIDILFVLGELTKPVLVVAPYRVAANTWPDEMEKWEHLKNLSVVPVLGNETRRAMALRTPAHVYTINYENLEWLTKYLGDAWPFGMIVADESTRLSSFRLRQGGKRAAALARVAHAKCDRFVNLTGTPTPGGYTGLWGQSWFLDAGERLGRTFTAFQNRWFRSSFEGRGYVILPGAGAEIEDKLRDICFSLQAKDYFNLEDPIENKIYVDLPPAARALYTNMEKEMFMQLAEHEVEVFGAAARTMKCLQLANGAAYVNKADAPKEWKEVHTAKLDALESVIQEASGMPVLVAYHFKSDLERLKARFKKGRELDKDPKTLREWNAGRIPILFAHPASAGHGLNLQDGGNILVFFSLNWNLEHHQQIIERIGPTRQLQAGYERPVFIHYIMARNTVDDLVFERLQGKKTVQDLLMESMRKFNSQRG